MELPKIVTPLEFINQLDHEWSQEGRPQEKLFEIHGRLHWLGRCYHDDLAAFVDAFRDSGFNVLNEEDNSELGDLAFKEYLNRQKDKPQRKGKLTRKDIEEISKENSDLRDDMFIRKLNTKVEYNGDVSEINLEGYSAYPDVDLKWSAKGTELVKKLAEVFPKFIEKSERDAELAVVFGRIAGFNHGVHMQKDENRTFLANKKGTLFYSKAGKRENFHYESMIPDSHWIFREPSTYRKRKSLIEILDNAYESIKDEVQHYSINTTYRKNFPDRKKACRIKMEFDFSDLDFKPYTPYKSALDLVKKYQKELGRVKTGGVVDYH